MGHNTTHSHHFINIDWRKWTSDSPIYPHRVVLTDMDSLKHTLQYNTELALTLGSISMSQTLGFMFACWPLVASWIFEYVLQKQLKTLKHVHSVRPLNVYLLQPEQQPDIKTEQGTTYNMLRWHKVVAVKKQYLMKHFPNGPFCVILRNDINIAEKWFEWNVVGLVSHFLSWCCSISAWLILRLKPGHQLLVQYQLDYRHSLVARGV